MGPAFFDSMEMNSLDSLTDCLSEKGACLLTGATEDLTHVAVDSNLRNIMPDNIALMSKSCINEILPVFEYCVTAGSLKIIFETGHLFEGYNISIIECLQQTSPETFKPVKKYEDIFEIWEFLARRHCKGISKISIEGEKVVYGLDKVSALQALTVAKVRHKKESKIVSPTGESIYDKQSIKIIQ